MKRRAIVAALLLCAVGFGAFAEVGTYFKGAVGYGYRWGMDWTTTYKWGNEEETWSWSDMNEEMGADDFNLYAHLVEIVPTFGIEPWRGSGNAFLRGLSFEISVDVGIGKASYTVSGGGESMTEDLNMAYIISPKVMAVYTHRTKVVAPYIGIGVSVPIAIIPELGGDNYNLTESDYGGTYGYETPAVKVGVNGNVMAGIGFMVTESVMPFIEADFGFGTDLRIDARAGLTYRFGM